MLNFVLAMCAAEVLGMLSISSFPALVPVFQTDWDLTNTEIGWISGIYFAGYVAGAPLLASLTDRIDARRVVLASLALGAAASLGYALMADGFWSALVLRALQGVGLAGTYMPGLKALSDRTEGPKQSRYVSFYTASYGIGAALSYLITGWIAEAADWRWAFGATAFGSVAAFAVFAAILPAGDAARPREPGPALLDFRPVLRNRAALVFILGYCGHNWELFAFRAWMVAYLVYSSGAQAQTLVSATTIAAAVTLIGVPASILGNELTLRLGRRRAILLVTATAVAVSLIVGISAEISYALVVALCFAYGILTIGDSAALTAGTVAAAAPGARGATLAMHASIGTAGAVIGPLAVGVVLDAAGADAALAWTLAFATMGVGSAFAFLALAQSRRD